MTIASNFLILLVGLIHFYIFYLEKFIWNAPAGLKVFKMTSEQAKFASVIMSNQAFYNLLLGVILIFSLVLSKQSKIPIHLSILIFIFLVGLYGGYTASKSIYFLQAIPAAIAILVLVMRLSQPSINDISTSFDSKMVFSDNSWATKSTQEIQKKYYPQIRSLILKSNTEKIYNAVVSIINSDDSLQMIKKDKVKSENDQIKSILIESKTKLMKYTDDVIIQIEDVGYGYVQVDIRSRSRVGKSDFGVNAKRIEQFFYLINSAISN